jgi:hypothetical protein
MEFGIENAECGMRKIKAQGDIGSKLKAQGTPTTYNLQHATHNLQLTTHNPPNQPNHPINPITQST